MVSGMNHSGCSTPNSMVLEIVREIDMGPSEISSHYKNFIDFKKKKINLLLAI